MSVNPTEGGREKDSLSEVGEPKEYEDELGTQLVGDSNLTFG